MNPVGRRWPRATSASQAAWSVAAMTAASSVHARWATWVATSQPAAGVGVRHPASGRSATNVSSRSPRGPPGRRAPRRACRSSHSRLSGCRAGARDEAPVETKSLVEGRRPLVEDPAATPGVVGDGRGQPEPAHQVERRLHQLAYAGRDSSTPSASTVSRWVSRPTRCSSGATAASRASSVRAATHSSSAAVKTGELKWSPSTRTTARVRSVPRGTAPSVSASSAPRSSVRCSTAARTRSFLVGKWWS